MSACEATFVTRCGCERRMAITILAPDVIDLPLAGIAAGDRPPANWQAIAFRRFHRYLGRSPRELTQEYYEVLTV